MNQVPVLYQTPTHLLIICPHCHEYHMVPTVADRSIELVAMCDSTKKYTLGKTMKAKSMASALKGYFYDLNRRKVAYRKKAMCPAKPLDVIQYTVPDHIREICYDTDSESDTDDSPDTPEEKVDTVKTSYLVRTIPNKPYQSIQSIAN